MWATGAIWWITTVGATRTMIRTSTASLLGSSLATMTSSKFKYSRLWLGFRKWRLGGKSKSSSFHTRSEGTMRWCSAWVSRANTQNCSWFEGGCAVMNDIITIIIINYNSRMVEGSFIFYSNVVDVRETGIYPVTQDISIWSLKIKLIDAKSQHIWLWFWDLKYIISQQIQMKLCCSWLVLDASLHLSFWNEKGNCWWSWRNN